ncbi:MAG: hypothetical protein VYA97_00815, partial [Pseudomonadota bacterium]|nr:hypothetical protein [Pseudomonadota bacterium]
DDGTGYALSSVTTTPVAGQTAVDVSVKIASSEAGEPELTRTFRLLGATTFDADSLMVVQPAAATV